MRKEGRRRDRGGFLIPVPVLGTGVSGGCDRKGEGQRREAGQAEEEKERKERKRKGGRGRRALGEGGCLRVHVKANSVPEAPASQNGKLPLLEVILPLSPQRLLWGQSLLSLKFESSSS